MWRGEQSLWHRHTQTLQSNVKRLFEDAANDPVHCDLRYQGQLEDKESGLYYNLNRYYDADSGQYLSSDPIGMAGGLRPQAYVHNPMEWVDPLGLADCCLYDWYKYNRSKGMTASEAHKAIKNASPQDIFDYALHRQGYTGSTYPTQFKERFTAGGYKYEVRAHDINLNSPEGSNSRNGPIYRVARSKQGINPETNQGYGWEQQAGDGTWYHVRDLKANSATYNAVAANDTHIPLPK